MREGEASEKEVGGEEVSEVEVNITEVCDRDRMEIW